MNQPPAAPGACPNCGNLNPAGAPACLRCGFALVAEGRASDSAAPIGPPPPGYPPPPLGAMPAPGFTPPPGAMPPPGAPPAPPAYPMVPVAPPPWPGAYPAKSKGTALLLEVLLGLFTTILGIGWFYAGATNTGVTWLVAGIAWNIFAFVLDICTLGIFTLVHVPVNIVLVIVSAVNLNSYTSQRPHLFRP
jgi:hypothetical protein